MVFDSEDMPRPKEDATFPRNLENMSIEELQEYIEELDAEKARVTADIAKKEASKSLADSVFGDG